jgi:hypothetical protein
LGSPASRLQAGSTRKRIAGCEVFYNAELWKGVNLTADLQYIDSAFGNGPLVAETPGDAWVGGLRLRIVL